MMVCDYYTTGVEWGQYKNQDFQGFRRFFGKNPKKLFENFPETGKGTSRKRFFAL